MLRELVRASQFLVFLEFNELPIFLAMSARVLDYGYWRVLCTNLLHCGVASGALVAIFGISFDCLLQCRIIGIVNFGVFMEFFEMGLIELDACTLVANCKGPFMDQISCYKCFRYNLELL